MRTTQVIVLNGISSAGKTTIARALQEILPGLWLTFGTDSYVEALPGRGESPRSGIEFGATGEVTIDAVFRAGEEAWYAGLAAMAERGARLILDEVLLAGGAGQDRLAAVLEGLAVLWVAVRCDLDVATAREARRPDRVVGMAARQAPRVHEGVHYDLEVDTSRCSPATAAATVASRVRT